MRQLLTFFLGHRTLALLRWDLHFLRVRLRNALTAQRRSISRALRREPRQYLNLGSGPRGLRSGEWLNIDGFKDQNVDFVCDFSRPLPLPDDVFSGVFTEHVLEHFTFSDGARLLKECQRVMKTGAVIRIVVPDGEKILRTYVSSPDELVSRRPGAFTAIDAVNNVFRQRYEHQYIYDWPTLRLQLQNAGFRRIYRAEFGESAMPPVALDDAKYRWESLYVEATK